MNKVRVSDIWVAPEDGQNGFPPLRETGYDVLDSISQVLRSKKIIHIRHVKVLLHQDAPYINNGVHLLTGMTFRQWVWNIQFYDTRWLLLHTRKTTVEIASLLGYGSIQAFRHFFIKFAGTSPVEYRKLRVRKKVIYEIQEGI